MKKKILGILLAAVIAATLTVSASAAPSSITQVTISEESKEQGWHCEDAATFERLKEEEPELVEEIEKILDKMSEEGVELEDIDIKEEIQEILTLMENMTEEEKAEIVKIFEEKTLLTAPLYLFHDNIKNAEKDADGMYVVTVIAAQIPENLESGSISIVHVDPETKKATECEGEYEAETNELTMHIPGEGIGFVLGNIDTTEEPAE